MIHILATCVLGLKIDEQKGFTQILIKESCFKQCKLKYENPLQNKLISMKNIFTLLGETPKIQVLNMIY